MAKLPSGTAAGFNEWMRRFIDEPAKFHREFETVAGFLADANYGVPSYGETCAEYLEKIMTELEEGEDG